MSTNSRWESEREEALERFEAIRHCWFPPLDRKIFLTAETYQNYLQERNRISESILTFPTNLADSFFLENGDYVKIDPERKRLMDLYNEIVNQGKSVIPVFVEERDTADGEERSKAVQSPGRCYFCQRTLKGSSTNRRFLEACDRPECQEDARQVKVAVLRRQLRKRGIDQSMTLEDKKGLGE